jgi:hypothetical protein
MLLEAMLEFCPSGEEKSKLSACLFLQRLRRKLRILLLLHEDMSNLKSFAAKADSLHSHRRDVVSVNVVAAVVQELSLEKDDRFAAVLQGQPSNKGGNSQNMEREPPSEV